MRSLTCCSLAVVFLAFAASSASAQLIPGWDTKQFTLEQIDANTVRLMREVEVNGAGPNAGQQIFADELLWNRLTGEFTAVGNVTMTTKEARISAEKVVFNTRTGRGTFHEASGQASLGARGAADRSMFGALEPDIMFAGETIEKIDVDKYRITNGWFTTCVQPTPRWEIVTGTATVNLEDYAILRNAVMRVKDVPIFYLPILYYPIQSDDRATGFLLPTYGNSLYRGQSLSNAFFWAVNRSQDVTLFHDWYTKSGQGIGSEYRYVAAPGSEGQLRAYALWQKATDIELQNGVTQTLQEGRSTQINASLAQVLPAGLRARARVDYFSDLSTQAIYNTNIYEASNRNRTIDANVAGAWGNVSASGTFRRTEIFQSSDESIVNGYAPQATVTLSSKRLGQLPFYVSMNNEASRIIYQDNRFSPTADLGLNRFDTTPTFRAALSNWPFLNISGTVAYRYTYYSESKDEIGEQVPVPISRRYFDLRTDIVGPTFSRVFNPNNAIADRLKHVIEPNVSIQRITDFDSLEKVAPTTSAYDTIIPGTTRVSYGLTNRVMVRKAPSDPAAAAASAPRELVSVALTQSYYTDSRASQFDTNYQSTSFTQAQQLSNFSPVALTARAAPSAFTTATLRLEFDHKDFALRSINATGNSNYRTVQVAAGWSKRISETYSDNIINASTTLNLAGGRTGGTYIINWDVGRGYVQQQRWTGFYNAQCCGIMAEYQVASIPSAVLANAPRDRRFNLSFTLAGIGSFSNFFGAFGGRTTY